MKEALIKLQGKAGLDENVIDFTSIARAEITKDSIYIEYDESEISGNEGSLSTVIITKDAVTLNRMGAWVSTMAFMEGQETLADILTPLGNLKINIFTERVKLNVSDNRVNLELDYTFSLGGQRINNYLTLSCHIR